MPDSTSDKRNTSEKPEKGKPEKFMLIAFSRGHGEALGYHLVNDGLIRDFRLVTAPERLPTLPNTLWIWPRPAPPPHRHAEIRAFARGFGWGQDTMLRILGPTGDPRDLRPRRLYLEYLIATELEHRRWPELESPSLADRIATLQERMRLDRPAIEATLAWWEEKGESAEHNQPFHEELALPIPELPPSPST